SSFSSANEVGSETSPDAAIRSARFFCTSTASLARNEVTGVSYCTTARIAHALAAREVHEPLSLEPDDSLSLAVSLRRLSQHIE
ncbi:MAG: hypothetical protein ABIT38_23945, partial [Gemmatimonadaceae bacterium]